MAVHKSCDLLISKSNINLKIQQQRRSTSRETKGQPANV